jgi:hypothetical protein
MRKTLLYSGIALTALILAGVILRLLHLPGSTPMLVIGIGLVMAYFLPMLLIHRIKNDTTRFQNITTIFGCVVGWLFLFPGLLFAIQRWPGSLMLVTGGIFLGIIFIVLFFLSRKNAGNPVVLREPFTIIIIALISILFTGRYFVREATNEKLKENIASYYSAMEKRLDADHAAGEAYIKVLNDTSDTAAVRLAEELHRATIDMVQYINETRGEVVGRCMGIDPQYGDTLSARLIDHPGDYDTPTHYFIGFDPANVTGKSKELKIVLVNYLDNYYSPDKTKKFRPDDVFSEEMDMLISWEWYNFYHRNIIETITTLAEIQTNILTLEKEALQKREFKK